MGHGPDSHLQAPCPPVSVGASTGTRLASLKGTLPSRWVKVSQEGLLLGFLRATLCAVLGACQPLPAQPSLPSSVLSPGLITGKTDPTSLNCLPGLLQRLRVS